MCSVSLFQTVVHWNQAHKRRLNAEDIRYDRQFFFFFSIYLLYSTCSFTSSSDILQCLFFRIDFYGWTLSTFVTFRCWTTIFAHFSSSFLFFFFFLIYFSFIFPREHLVPMILLQAKANRKKKLSRDQLRAKKSSNSNEKKNAARSAELCWVDCVARK